MISKNQHNSKTALFFKIQSLQKKKAVLLKQYLDGKSLKAEVNLLSEEISVCVFSFSTPFLKKCSVKFELILLKTRYTYSSKFVYLLQRVIECVADPSMCA